MLTSVRIYDTIALGLLNKEEECQIAIFFFTSRGTYVNCAIIAIIPLEISGRTRGGI